MTTHTAATVKEDLFQAGRILKRLAVRGCWPGGHKSSMPDYIQEGFAGALTPDGEYHRAEVRSARPTAQEIDAMDRIIEWFGLVPEWQTISGRRVEISLRHLLWARIYPLPPLRGRVEAIAKHLGCDRKTVYRHIGYACETIAGALNKEDHIW